MTAVNPPPSIPDLILFMQDYYALSIMALVLTAAVVGKTMQQTGSIPHAMFVGGMILLVATFFLSDLLRLRGLLEILSALMLLIGLIGVAGDK